MITTSRISRPPFHPPFHISYNPKLISEASFFWFPLKSKLRSAGTSSELPSLFRPLRSLFLHFLFFVFGSNTKKYTGLPCHPNAFVIKDTLNLTLYWPSTFSNSLGKLPVTSSHDTWFNTIELSFLYTYMCDIYIYIYLSAEFW